MRGRTIAQLSLATVLALAALAPAQAQYKWLDERGRINYGDRMPSGNVKLLEGPNGPIAPAASGLPYMLKQTTDKHPVVLYTTSNCQPCKPAREHLKRRGVPYSERLVETTAEAEAFKKLGFSEVGFPSVAIGGQKAVGYEVGVWDSMLSGAGYPKRSLLPRAWRQPDAQPLLSRAARGSTQSAQAKAPGRSAVASGLKSPDVDTLSAKYRFRF
ncbi:MAG: glutaredoxin family protein [Burkholderiaceae bacterium]